MVTSATGLKMKKMELKDSVPRCLRRCLLDLG